VPPTHSILEGTLAKRRKSISTSLRYDIFTRDGYTCQYCGSKPPDVVLELDHRVPVSAGGDNDPMNLLTACWGCNSGKRDKLPGHFTPVPDADLQMLKVSQEAAEYQRYMEASKRTRAIRAEVIEHLQDIWHRSFGGDEDVWVPKESVIEGWLARYPPDVIENAILAAIPAYLRNQISSKGGMFNKCLRYVGAIIRNMDEAGVA